MRKLLLLICALLTSVSGAWADGTVTIGTSSNIQSKSTFYYSNGSIAPWGNWCQKAVFGAVSLEGTVSNTTGYFRVDGAPHTITISVPSSMKITAYSFDLKQLDGTGCTANGTELNNSSFTTVSGSSLNTNSVTITFANTPGSGECRIQVENFTVTYTGSMTPADLSTSKCYNIRNNRGTWAVSSSSATDVNSTYELNLAYSSSDAKQQFAFVEVFGKYYLYSVAAQKFAYVSGTKLALTDKFNYNVQHSPVTFTASTSSTYKDYSPVIITVGGQQFGVSKGYSPDVYKYNDATDDGNAAWLVEAGSFDSSTASTQIVNSRTTLFELSTAQAPKYYAWRTAVGNAPSYIYTDNGNPANPNDHSITKTNPIDAKYAWAFIGDYDNGCLIKNKATGTYLGGRTASGGDMAMEETANSYFYPLYNGESTNVWYCLTYDYYIDRASNKPYAHTSGNNNDYIRLYEVTFSLSNASAGLKVGTETISDFSTPILITAEAALTCADEDYRIKTYDGYSALAEALTNDADGVINIVVEEKKSVTYNLTWGGAAISSKTSVQKQFVGEAVAAAATVFGTAPAYCSYGTPDVATIGESTTTVNVALNWAGPFDISSDFENANWCYLKMHGQYLIYSGSAPSFPLCDLAAAEAAGYNAFWAFVGDPVNGFQLINKAAGSDKNLVVAWFPNMGTANTKWFLQQWNDDFALRTNTYLYLNNADGQLKLWVSDQSEEETDFDCKIESASYRGLALAFIDDYADSHAVGHYFGVATSTYNSVRAGYADAASVSASDYTQLVSFIGGMLPASYPETGYYRIKSNSGRYIGYGQPEADPMPSVGLRTVSAEDAAKDASTIIHLVKGVGSHQYTMSTQGKNVQSMVNGNTPFPATSDAGVTFVLEALTTTPGKGTIRNTASNNEDNGYINGYLHEANWTVPGVINWEAGSESSQWSIEDVTSIDVTLRDGGDGYYYTTAYFDFPVSYTGASNGEGLFVLTGESNGKATAQKVTSVPKTQGFLIRIAAKNVTDSKVTLTIPASADALAGDNILTGTCLATTKPDGKVYVFSKVGDDLGFFPYTGSDIPANRAYIVEPAGSGTRSFILSFDETTGINGVSTSMPAGTIFDMQGRRVNKAEKGLYIVNGKKVLF